MIKGKLISLIRDKLTGGDSSPDLLGRWHPEIIATWIELALGSVVADLNGDVLKYSDYVQLDWFIKAYENITINHNEGRDEYYAELPAKPVRLPGNNGIRLISFMQGQREKFVLRNNNNSSVLDSLECSSATTRISYYVEKDKVFFGSKFPKDMENSTLLMKLIVFEGLEDTEDIPIPAGKELMFIEFVYKVILGKLPEDNKQDMVPNQVEQ